MEKAKKIPAEKQEFFICSRIVKHMWRKVVRSGGIVV